MPSTFFPARPEVRPSIHAYRDKSPDHANFHKAFGYGEVVDIDRASGFIEVALGTDRHGRPKRRTFLFPNAFEQGMLTL